MLHVSRQRQRYTTKVWTQLNHHKNKYSIDTLWKRVSNSELSKTPLGPKEGSHVWFSEGDSNGINVATFKAIRDISKCFKCASKLFHALSFRMPLPLPRMYCVLVAYRSHSKTALERDARERDAALKTRNWRKRHTENISKLIWNVMGTSPVVSASNFVPTSYQLRTNFVPTSYQLRTIFTELVTFLRN